MAVKAKYTRLLVNQWDFSDVSNALDVSFALDKQDVTTFQADGKQYLVMGAEGTITQKGYLTGVAANYFEKEIFESVKDAESLTVAALFGTDTAACPAYVAPGCNTDGFGIQAPAAGVITLNGQWGSGSGILRGLRVWSGTFSATGAQTTPGYIDLGGAGSAGGKAWLFVQTITGAATNATITLQSDDATDFVGAATEGTFTFSAVGAYEITLSGAVDRYVRLNCTSKGGATSFVVVGIVAVDGVTY
jgi:hypothetical protein